MTSVFNGDTLVLAVDIHKKYGRLTPIKFVKTVSSGKSRVRLLDYWLFKCDCGEEKMILEKTVKAGRAKSCGCFVHDSRHRLPKGEAACNVLWYTYKANSSRRNLEFSLSKEQFKELTKQNCYYCGVEPSQTVKRPKFNGNYLYNGVDRVDNSIGYTLSNCVTCCETCNRAKLEMSVETFEKWIKRVHLNIMVRKNGNRN